MNDFQSFIGSAQLADGNLTSAVEEATYRANRQADKFVERLEQQVHHVRVRQVQAQTLIAGLNVVHVVSLYLEAYGKPEDVKVEAEEEEG